MYDYILFDLDGTLTDSGPGITNAVKYALGCAGISEYTDRQLLSFIGPPLTDSFERVFGMTGEENTEAVKNFRVYYNTMGGKFESRLYDGIQELFEGLTAMGKKLVLCTSKAEPAALEITSHYGLDKYFIFQAGGIDVVRSSKDRVIAHALKAVSGLEGHEIDLSRVVMVGDREHDIFGAAANGIDSIGVLFGFGSLDELTAAGAVHIAGSPGDILKLV